MKGKLVLSMSLLIISIFLSGCGESVEEGIYNKLEKTIEIESSDASKKLTELEIKDKELLNEIASFNDQELDKVNKKADEAIETNENLKETLKEEEKNFNKAKKQFKKSESSINKLEEDSEKELGLEMYEVMMNRYDTYNELAEEYNVAIDEKIKFYKLMKEEDAEQKKVLKQVEKINKHNEKTIKLNNTFNEDTEKYNALKKDLYEKMELNIEFND